MSEVRNVGTGRWLWQFRVVMVEEGMLHRQQQRRRRQRQLLLRRTDLRVQTFLRLSSKLRNMLSHRPNEVSKFLTRELGMRRKRFLRLLTKSNQMMGWRCDPGLNRIPGTPNWRFELRFRDREVFETGPTDRDPTIEDCLQPKKL